MKMDINIDCWKALTVILLIIVLVYLPMSWFANLAFNSYLDFMNQASVGTSEEDLFSRLGEPLYTFTTRESILQTLGKSWPIPSIEVEEKVHVYTVSYCSGLSLIYIDPYSKVSYVYFMES